MFESSASFRLVLGRVRTPYRCLVSGFCLVRLLASVVGRVSLFDLPLPCFFTLCNGSLLFSLNVLRDSGINGRKIIDMMNRVNCYFILLLLLLRIRITY